MVLAPERCVLRKAHANEGGKLYRIGRPDTVIMRIPHGHMEPKDITEERLLKHIHHCGKIYGARTVIIMMLPFNNSVFTHADWLDNIKINRKGLEA